MRPCPVRHGSNTTSIFQSLRLIGPFLSETTSRMCQSTVPDAGSRRSRGPLGIQTTLQSIHPDAYQTRWTYREAPYNITHGIEETIDTMHLETDFSKLSTNFRRGVGLQPIFSRYCLQPSRIEAHVLRLLANCNIEVTILQRNRTCHL